MASDDDPRRPHWHAELVQLEAERRRVAIAIGWAQRAGPPREVARLQREAARVRRRIARLRELLSLAAPQEEA
jgi:transcription elongation GreA/GreB family factor